DFSATTPAIDWTWMLPQLHINNADSVVVNNTQYFKSLDSMLNSVSLNDWKTYVKWHLVNSASAFLRSPFVKQDFSFTSLMTGQKEQEPRWQFVSSVIDRQMGDMLGQLYVQKYFAPGAKQRMLDLVNKDRKSVV